MADNKPKLQSENTKSNFGKGWLIIFYSMIMFFFLIGFSIDGQNIVIDQWINANGDSADPAELKPQLLKLAMYAGFIGVVAYFVIGRILVMVGGRALSAVCLALAGASYIYYGHSTTTTGYFIGLTLVTVFINGAGNTVVPEEKGSGKRIYHHGSQSGFCILCTSDQRIDWRVRHRERYDDAWHRCDYYRCNRLLHCKKHAAGKRHVS